MIELESSEKIDNWDVIVKTTNGRELSILGDMDIDLPETATRLIDEILQDEYSCTWDEDEPESEVTK